MTVPVNPGNPVVSGIPQTGQVLTTTVGCWLNGPTSYTFTWLRAGAAIPGANGQTYAPVVADVGFTLQSGVVANNADGQSLLATSLPTAPVIAAVSGVPVNTVLPTISGTPQVGQTLTATNGIWTNSPTSFTYQWNRAGTAIGGATASTYVPVSADVGNTLTISVTATNGTGSSAPATSAATGAVIDIIATNSSVPTISGTAQVGQTLTATTGTWTHNPTSFTYQWNRAGGAISGATASTYVPVAADVGNTLTVAVVARNSGGSSAPATSAATGAVIDIIATNSSVPTISGTAQVGQTLTATTGTWTHNPTSFTYQWNRAGGAISGATASTYVPVAADVGNTLMVAVVARNSGGSSAPATSAATSTVIPAPPAVPVNTALPTISGTPQVGQTLTATNGTWTNSPTSFAYQWNRAGGAISGATASTYVPVAADVGNTLTVSVTAANGSGSSAPATSAATSAIIDIIPTINTAASIPGTPQVGSPITATDAVWNHSVTSVAYQWKAAGINGTGTGATTLTYTPAAGDFGKTLTITVTATNSGGTSAPSTSAASAVVIAAGSVPALSPTATLFNTTLSATFNGWTGYQSRQIISAANLTLPSFTLGLIQVTFTLATGSSGATLTGSDIGNLGTSNPISFDGNQVPLKFGGSSTITGLGPGAFVSDAVPFTINPVSGIIISTLWGAGTINSAGSSTSNNNTTSSSNTITDQTATTPPNYPAAWDTRTNQCLFISNITFSAAPFITGVAQVGQTLTASHGAWTNSPTSYTYQWNRAGSAISGATAATYVPITADVGNTLTVAVVAKNSGGSSTPATSAATSTVTIAGSVPVNTAVPTIS
ncbi:MAG: hypothetical protein M3178_01420 [Pseudomonadota bacterium]|nr:hypothetical protein [Pseudomonadota bacterium]